MAGEGSRFSKLGYGTPKPLIKVSNLPMFIQAAKSLPKSKKYSFVCKNNLDISESKTSLKKYFQNYSFTKLNSTPPGQAISTYEGIKNLNKGLINISACDHGVIFDNKKLKKILGEKNFDILVWTKRGYIEASLNPNMYSWVLTESDKIKNVSVKKSLSNPIEDHLLIGTFTFLNKEIYIECFKKLLDTKEKVNNEIYIDSMINLAIKKGYRCKIFEVDECICWGTPNEFKTFEYWRNCFNLLKSHPYKSNNEELF